MDANPEIAVAQTAGYWDDRALLNLTATANFRYCQIHGYHYENYFGRKRGAAPAHAIYNPIFVLQEFLARGYGGWVVLLDAATFIADFTVALDRALAPHNDQCLLAAAVGEAAVLLFNLGHFEGRNLAQAWVAEFNAVVPELYLAAPGATPGAFPDALALLQNVLAATPALAARVKQVDLTSLSKAEGGAIRSAPVTGFASNDDRLRWLVAEIQKVLAQQPITPKST